MLVVTGVDGTAYRYEGSSRFMTDEQNNLCVFADQRLLGVHSAGQWRSAVLEGEEP